MRVGLVGVGPLAVSKEAVDEEIVLFLPPPILNVFFILSRADIDFPSIFEPDADKMVDAFPVEIIADAETPVGFPIASCLSFAFFF